MNKIRARFSRSALANGLGVAGAAWVVGGAWDWRPVAGMVLLGVFLLVAGWAVDE